MKIAADENIPLVKEAFATLGEVVCKSGREICTQDLHDTDILLVRSVTEVNEALLAGTPVKFVASATAGFNHVDVAYLQSQDIGFARAPGSNALSAAEYVIAALCYWSLQSGQSLKGLSLGIIGCGQVGSRVAKLANALGLVCIKNDPPLQEKGGQGYQSLEAALACDIVTLHVPLEYYGTHPTFELIDEAAVRSLAANTVFINASRGEVVQESVLLRRLQSEADLTVILDVWLNEPSISQSLLELVFLATPHIAGYSYDGKIRGTEMIYKACAEFIGSALVWNSPLSPPDYEVNREHQYRHELQQSVLRAYDIKADDERLRKIMSSSIENPAEYFDYLRKSYPIRREYSSCLFPEVIEL